VARWHYLDPALVWLFPAAYAAHLAEETFAGEGLRLWLGRLGPAPLSLAGFVVVNAVGMTVFVAGARLATRRQGFGWVAISLSTIVLLNAVLHVLGTLVTRVYSPGLATAVVLYVPLGGLTALRAATQAPAAEWQRGLAAGIVLQAAVSALALSGLLAGG
jgi:hypothetical protein